MSDLTGIFRGTNLALLDGQQAQLSIDGTGALRTTSSAPQGSDASTQGGTIVQGRVVSGNQGYAVGTTQILNMEPGGRLKVSVSYAANVTPATRATSNDGAALIAGIYYATRPTFSDGFTGALQVSARGNLFAQLNDENGNSPVVNGYNADDGGVSTLGLVVASNDRYLNPLTNLVTRSRGDTTGTWVHAPASTFSAQSGTIATSGGTAAIAFTNTSDTEVLNPSAGTLWASWGTPAVNGAGSFPIAAGGSYRPPSRVAGTLTLLSTAANQPYTANRFS